MYQRQIDYTRDNEAEADRVGMQIAGAQRLRPHRDVRILRHLQGWVRANQGGARTHARLPANPPDHRHRISEAKERAAQIKPHPLRRARARANPLLPGNLRLPGPPSPRRHGPLRLGQGAPRA
jgi:predicted Zn-dependent protease